MALDIIQRELGIAAGERGTLAEIRKRIGADEIIAPEHAFDAFADDLRREQFGERGGDRLEQRSVANEMDVGVDRKARCGQETRERNDVVAIEFEGFGELEPARDASVAY